MNKYEPKSIDLLHYRRVMVELVELIYGDLKQIIVMDFDYDKFMEENSNED